MNLVKKEKILIVDDDETIRDFLCEVLSEEGYSIDFAENGIKALNKLNEAFFDLILTDIKMPGMDGLELMKNIKQKHIDMVVLVITGYANFETALAAIKCGAYDFLLKPLNINQIKLAINNAMDRHRLSQENARLKETILLYETSKAISKTININDLYQLVLNSALNLTKASRGSLMIINEEKREPLLVTDISNHPLCKKISHQFPDKSFISFLLTKDEEDESIAVPLKIRKEVIGVLNINRPKRDKIFTEGDLRLLSIFANQAAVCLENAKLVKNLEETYLSTIKSLSLILDEKSHFTQGHSERVTKYALEIAQEMSLTSSEINSLKDGAILHDIGKIGISDNILNKPGKLTVEEYDIIKTHPVVGYEMLKPIQILKNTLPIIRNHHERMDGKGYPDGISGENLSCVVHICIVADAFDAMTSNRPYRNALGRKAIFAELDKNTGTQFDKEVVKVLMKKEESKYYQEPYLPRTN